jgi:hypothetical protein
VNARPERKSNTRTKTVSSPADLPNMPEVSGTSFPLLTTVLAGFAVTIAVQLIIRPEASADLSTRETAAIIIFLASTLVFISSIVFAVNAQAHNYLPFIELDPGSRQILGIDDHQRWITWLQRSWDSFHLAAILTFYGGILLLLGGVNLIVWEFIGSGVAIVFLALILANILLTVGIGVAIERRKRATSPTFSPAPADARAVNERANADGSESVS